MKKKLSKLRQVRLEAGLSQEDLSKLSGVGRTTIVRIEGEDKGALNATLKNLLRLAVALHCTVDDLIEYDYANSIKEDL